MATKQADPTSFAFALASHSFVLPNISAMRPLSQHILESKFRAGPYTLSLQAHVQAAVHLDVLGVFICRVFEDDHTVKSTMYPDDPAYSPPAFTTWQFCVEAGSLERRPIIMRMRLSDRANMQAECVGVAGASRVCSLEELRKAQAEGHSVTISVRLAAAMPAPKNAKGKSQQMGPADAICIRTWREPDPSYQSFWGGEDAPFADCNVRAGDGVVFPCHRVVLSAASPVFRAAFAGGMREAVQQELVVQDAASDTLRLLLQHAYGRAPLDVPLPLLLPLLRLADQYGMEELRDAGRFCLLAADLSGVVLASLLPQARVLELSEIAAFLAGRIVFDAETWQAAERSGLLGSWQLLDAVLVLGKGKGGFLGFQAALAWVQQAAAAAAAGAAAAGRSGAAGRTQEAADVLDMAEAQAAPMADGMAAAAGETAAAAEAAATAMAAEAEQSVEPASKRRRTSSTTAPAAFDAKAAWAALLPLVRFKEGFTEQQLIEARALPGADGVPGLAQALLEAWEAKAKQRVAAAAAAAPAVVRA